jgi:hypothetical protein
MLLHTQRFGLWGLALLTLAGVAQPAAAQQAAAQQAAAQQAAVPVYPAPSDAEQKIDEALAQPTQLEFLETPLSDVVGFLADHHDVRLQIDRSALDAVGIGSDTPITLHLKGVPLSSALALMLRDLDLTYVVRDDVLLITTTDVAEEMVELRVYDVSTLLGPGDSTDSLARLLMETFATSRHTVDSNAAYATPEQELARRDQGPSRVINGYRNLLLVRDSFHGHRDIARALNAMSHGLASAAPASAIINPAAPSGTPPGTLPEKPPGTPPADVD